MPIQPLELSPAGRDTRVSPSPRVHRLGQLLIALSLAIGAIIAFASRRLPCEPASGSALNGNPMAKQVDAPAATQRIRIATFNIHSGVGTDGRFDLGRIADALREFDLVGLNEVRGPRPWCADQAEQLGTQLDRHWLFAPFERRWFREDFGNAVLSRMPVSQWRRTPLPCTTRKGHGNLLELTLATTPHPLRVLITHVDRQTDHDAQLKAAINRFLMVSPPAILMGDLNATRDDPQIAELLRDSDVREALQCNGGASSHSDDSTRIDWIFTRGLAPIRSEVVSGQMSDHPLVWVELEFDLPQIQSLLNFEQPGVALAYGRQSVIRRKAVNPFELSMTEKKSIPFPPYGAERITCRDKGHGGIPIIDIEHYEASPDRFDTPPTADEAFACRPLILTCGNPFSFTSFDNVRIEVQSTAVKAGRCKFYFGIGPARLRTKRYKCVVQYDQTEEWHSPEKSSRTWQHEEVVYLDDYCLIRGRPVRCD